MRCEHGYTALAHMHTVQRDMPYHPSLGHVQLIAASTDTQLSAANAIAPHERAMQSSTRINRETKSEDGIDTEVDEKTSSSPHKELCDEVCKCIYTPNATHLLNARPPMYEYTSVLVNYFWRLQGSWMCCLCAHKNVPTSLNEESAAAKLSSTETTAASPDNQPRCSMCNSPR